MISSLFYYSEPSNELSYVMQNGVLLECSAVNEKMTISRVISTDPRDYLLYEPGTELKQ